MTDTPPAPGREPIFNVPGIVMLVVLTLASVHLYRSFLDSEADLAILIAWSFVPARFSTAMADLSALVDLDLPWRWLTVLTYGGLHGGIEHLVANLLWLLVFGSPVAWRFGTLRFVLLLAAGTAAGAGAHYLAYPTALVPMVGASAGISALTAAAARFVFQPGGPLGGGRGEPDAFRVPAAGLVATFSDGRALAFLGVWLALTLLFGLGSLVLGERGGSVAWQAHLGGFLAGLVLFPLLDPVPRAGD